MCLFLIKTGNGTYLHVRYHLNSLQNLRMGYVFPELLNLMEWKCIFIINPYIIRYLYIRLTIIRL